MFLMRLTVVAMRKLKFWELEIDELTEEQEIGLNSWQC